MNPLQAEQTTIGGWRPIVALRRRARKSAAAACDSLIAAGIKPTRRKVRAIVCHELEAAGYSLDPLTWLWIARLVWYVVEWWIENRKGK